MKIAVSTLLAALFFGSTASALGLFPYTECKQKAAAYVEAETGRQVISTDVLGPDDDNRSASKEVFVRVAGCEGGYSVFLDYHCTWINRALDWTGGCYDRRPDYGYDKGYKKGAPKYDKGYQKGPDYDKGYQKAPDYGQGKGYQGAPDYGQGKGKGKGYQGQH